MWQGAVRLHDYKLLFPGMQTVTTTKNHLSQRMPPPNYTVPPGLDFQLDLPPGLDGGYSDIGVRMCSPTAAMLGRREGG